MQKFNILIILCLLSFLGCGGSSTETQTITQIVEVPPPDPIASDIMLNISASRIDGAFSQNDGAFPANIYDDGEILLQTTNPTDQFVIGVTPSQNYDVWVINDDYQAIYRVDSAGQQAPKNQNAIVFSGQTIAADQTLNINVLSVEITPIFTLNGSSFPASQYDHGLFYLQPVDSDELIFIGDSNIVNAPFQIVPGNYHVVYNYQQGSVSPINSGAQVMTDITLDTNQTLRVNVLSGDLRASFTLNGNSFPGSQYDHAEFFLKDRTSGSEFFLMKSFNPLLSAKVIDGSYDVIYKLVQSSTVPLNSAKIIASNLLIVGGGAINQDIATISVGANVTLNGNAFQSSEYQDGLIELFDNQTQSYTLLGNTHSPFDNLVLIAGTYDVTYTHETGDAVPQNTHGTVLSDQLIDSDGVLQIAVTGILITPTVTLNTASFSQSPNQSASLFLSGAQTSEPILVSTTSNQSESVMVMPGTYDFYYQHNQGAAVPQNSWYQILSGQNLQADANLSANIQSVYIQVAATLNQQAFPQSFYQTADIFASSGPGDEIFVLETYSSGDATMLIPGDYEFYYQHVQGENLPLNHWGLIDTLSIDALPSR